ncbi:MutT/nudix family protein [Streptococcus pneumoniae]|uniref:MutT/nudix family protein n=1 Tax=Streptococcus pneumoniae TaxID=1313 RepID=A0A822QA78_STREE|nr:MutT/nudix family protein [Streptococcus pneumoniae]
MIALTDTGLTFTKDPFDRERYEDLRSLLSEMLNQVSDLDADEVAELLKPTSAYATPLMDVRALIVEVASKFLGFARWGLCHNNDRCLKR